MSVGSLLPKLSLRRPVTVVMTVLAASMIGAIAYFQIPVQLFPSGYTSPYLYVRVIYPNSTPKEVEDQIVRPAEELFATIKGLERMRSWATSQHGSFWMRFNSWSSMTNIYNQVRDRLERLMPTFPEDVDRYYIWKWDPDASPIFRFAISMSVKSKDNFRQLEQNLFVKIRRIPGISNVKTSGIEQPSVRIEVDRRRAKSHRISLYSLIRKLRTDNFSLPSGRFADGGRMFYIRSHNRIQSIKALRDYPVASGVKLHEIARVVFGEDPSPYISTINNKPSIFVDVYKESEANTIVLCNKLRTLLRTEFKTNEELSTFAPHVFTDQGKLIQAAIDQLQQAAFWGGIFALLILSFFLRHLRMTILITMAIPLSLLITLGAIYFMGESLNLLTLMGLMLSVGMVVDNAIVVVENISRLRQQGESAYQSALKGASEVALAILLATSTTIVVFLPLILMSDSRDFRFYMSKIGYPVCIALGASLLVALLFTPLGAVRLLGSQPPKPWPLFERVTQAYRRMLSWVIRHRFDVTVIGLLLMGSCQYPAKRIKRTTRTRPRNNNFRLRFTFPQNYNFKLKKRYLDKVYKLVHSHRSKWGVHYVMIRLGRYSNHGTVNVWFHANKKSKIFSDRRAIRRLMRDLLPNAPGVVRRVGWRPLGGDQGATITLLIYGPDSHTLEKVGLRVEKHLRQFPEFKQTEADIGRDILPEIQLRIQRRWTLRYQLPSNMVAGNVYYALSGRRLRDLQIKGRDVPVRIQIQPDDRQSFHQLQQLPLIGAQGSPVPLGHVVRSKFSQGPRVIGRLNRRTYMRIKISTSFKDLARMYKKIDDVMRGFPLPRRYSWSKGFEFRRFRRADASRQFALLLSITFVFLLMGILFESYLLPFCVLLSIPLAFLGVYWTLYLTDTPLDLMASIGLIMLIGLVVNHAIVLVDRINQLREEGFPRDEAILEAGAQRLRPILMTALTTIFGLLPMALGGSAMIGVSYAPLGRTVIGGLTVSALLSLIMVPVFYSFLDDFRLHLTGLLSRVRNRFSNQSPVTPAD